MKILATGDLHLGAGTEYGRQPGDRLLDQEKVWARILHLAAEREVDLILFAGDAFEGPTPTSEHYEAFLGPLRRHAATTGIPVLAISGNGKHDSAMRATNALEIFDGAGLTVHSRPGVWHMDYRNLQGAIATLPWVHPGRLVAKNNGGDRDQINAEVADLIVGIAEIGKQECEQVAPGGPHILLGHWSVTGSSLPNGLPVGQLREPVLPHTALLELGFDAIVLGHIHKPQAMSDEIPFFYVGSPLPLNFGETQTGHGVTILDLEPGLGALKEIEFVPIESRPLVTIDADITGIDGDPHNAIVDELDPLDLHGAIVRLRYRATADQARRIDAPILRAIVLDDGAAVVKIQPDIVREERARIAGLDESAGELDALDQYLTVNKVDPALAERARAKTAEYLEVAA